MTLIFIKESRKIRIYIHLNVAYRQEKSDRSWIKFNVIRWGSSVNIVFFSIIWSFSAEPRVYHNEILWTHVSQKILTLLELVLREPSYKGETYGGKKPLHGNFLM